ncbi:MAG: Sec-independent protein translocase protein TatB [Devosia sp.]
MLGLGWTEMLVVGVVALIFIGPKDLPVVMNRIGKIIGQVKSMGTEFQREINKTSGLDEVRNLRNSITAPLKKTTDEIRKEFNAMTPTGAKPSGAIKPANPAAESVVDEIKAKAGMTETAVPLTADEAAKAAGFKPAGPAPTTSSATFGKPSAVAAKKAPAKTKTAAKTKATAKAKPVPTSQVASSDLAPVDAPASTASKPATKRPAARKTAAKSVTTKAAAADVGAPVKPAAAKPAPAKSAKAAKPETAAKPATKRRAPAKTKPQTATTTADKAGDE